jgi:hypothetical protein
MVSKPRLIEHVFEAVSQKFTASVFKITASLVTQ